MGGRQNSSLCWSAPLFKKPQNGLRLSLKAMCAACSRTLAPGSSPAPSAGFDAIPWISGQITFGTSSFGTVPRMVMAGHGSGRAHRPPVCACRGSTRLEVSGEPCLELGFRLQPTGVTQRMHREGRSQCGVGSRRQRSYGEGRPLEMTEFSKLG